MRICRPHNRVCHISCHAHADHLVVSRSETPMLGSMGCSRCEAPQTLQWSLSGVGVCLSSLASGPSQRGAAIVRFDTMARRRLPRNPREVRPLLGQGGPAAGRRPAAVAWGERPAVSTRNECPGVRPHAGEPRACEHSDCGKHVTHFGMQVAPPPPVDQDYRRAPAVTCNAFESPSCRKQRGPILLLRLSLDGLLRSHGSPRTRGLCRAP